jgi:hypothetical protein
MAFESWKVLAGLKILDTYISSGDLIKAIKMFVWTLFFASVWAGDVVWLSKVRTPFIFVVLVP